jgi:hypothetical protein
MKTTKMKGKYPTLDGELTVTFVSVVDGPDDFTDFQNIELFEDDEEVSYIYLEKKYGKIEAQRFYTGAIRNANAV